nr:immunoglobulin light chain junction region [Macaca mulatta]
CQQGYIYPWTF